MKFCGGCGAALARRCPLCEAEVPSGFRFCGQCGASLQESGVRPLPASAMPTPAAPSGSPSAVQTGVPPLTAAVAARSIAAYTPKHLAEKILQSRSALEGERRQVTVLFADVAGFTSLAEHLDPEEVHRIINRCFELITAEVHRFEGTINQYTGDGVMALFGAPIAHEDSPRRAVHAALGIQRALRDYGRESHAQRGVTLQMRIGLNTGPVVVGRIGDDLRMDYTAVGDTTNLAARMQQIARPGSVMITEATHHFVEGFFDTLELGEVDVKGRAPVKAWEVLRPRGRRSRLDVAAERGLTPLVGRGQELRVLLERFADVKAGRGQVVSLVGEAGIGKSRLVYEFRQRLAQQDEGVTWLEGQCVSFGQSIPYLPLVDQLRRNFSIDELDGETEIIAKVEHGMRRMGQLEAHLPYIRFLLAVDPGDPSVAAMDPLARRRRVFEAVRALSLRGASIRPIVFVFEDLHWMDSSTEEYLGAFLDSVAAVPILMLLTYRTDYTPPFGARSFHTSLMLRSLSAAETIAIAGNVLGTDRFPEQVKTALLDKAEGIPLFVEEVAKTLLDLGILRREEGGLRVVKGLAEASVPDTIHDILMARLDRLGDEGKRTVQLAAVIGRRFLVRLLDRVAGMKDRLDGLLAELKALEIVYEQGLLPEPAYIFKHAVIQDVAYNSLLRERRRELHRRVGEAIEELFADRLAEHCEELAHHYVNGEHWSKAFTYLVKSGDRAKDAYANQVALDFYASALDVAARVVPPVSPRQIMEVHQRRSAVLFLLTRYPDAIVESQRVLALAREAGDRWMEAEGQADLALTYYATFSSDNIPLVNDAAEAARALAEETGHQRVLAKALNYLGLVDQVRGELAKANRKLEESLRIAEPGGFRDAEVQSLVWLGAHAEWQGQFREAIHILRRTEATAAEIHDGFFELLAPAFSCLAHIALGEYGAGMHVLNQALAKARERNNVFVQGRLINTQGWLYQELGDFARAHEANRESVDIGRRIKNSNVEISAEVNIGLDHLGLGEPQRALAHLEDCLTRIEKFGFGAHRWRWSIHAAVYLGEALLVLGEPEQAVVQADKALIQARTTGSMKYVGKALALRGEAARRARAWSDAERDLGEALTVARRIGYPTLTWQAAHGLALAQAGAGKTEEAFATSRLAADTIAGIAAAAPEPALRRTFLAWPRVQAVQDMMEKLTRSG
jgi:class 3 adenylate cyclase/tetratricopeptide (TPR) repeat protein